MECKAWLYFGFTAFLVLVLTGIIVYFYRNKRKDRVESPKYRMMDDE
jgi:cbb3-type cytochrome oxidase subunit 3